MKFVIKIALLVIGTFLLGVYGLFSVDSYLKDNIENNAQELAPKLKNKSQYFLDYQEALNGIKMHHSKFLLNMSNLESNESFKQSLDNALKRWETNKSGFNNDNDFINTKELLLELDKRREEISERKLVLEGFKLELNDAGKAYQDFVTRNKLKKNYEILFYVLTNLKKDFHLAPSAEIFDKVKDTINSVKEKLVSSRYRKKPQLIELLNNYQKFFKLVVENQEKLTSLKSQIQDKIYSLEVYNKQEKFKASETLSDDIKAVTEKAHLFRKIVFFAGCIILTLFAGISIPSLKILFGHAKSNDLKKQIKLKNKVTPTIGELQVVPSSLKKAPNAIKEIKRPKEKVIEPKKEEPFIRMYGPHLPMVEHADKISENISRLSEDMKNIEDAKRNIEAILKS